MKKPRWMFLLALCLSLTGLACGPESRSRMGRLLVWTSHNNEEIQLIQELAERFEKEFQKKSGRTIEVTLGRVAHEGLETKLKSAALSGTTPDLCRIDVAHVATLAWGQACVRLDTLPGSPFQDQERWKKHFLPAAFASNLVPVPSQGKFETGLYGIPEQTNCLVLFRNRALFEAKSQELRARGLDPNQAPQTFSELIAYGTELADPQADRFAFGMKNTLWWSLPFLYSGGGGLFQPDPKLAYRCLLNTPASHKAYSFWADLTRVPHARADGSPGSPVEGGFWRSEQDQHKAFLEGRLAMAFSGPWSVPLFRSRVPDMAVSKIPEGPGGSISTIGGSNLVMMKSCKDREAGLAFLEFMAQDEVQLEISRKLNQIPTTKSALSQRKAEADATLRVFLEQMERAQGRPPLPNFEPIEKSFQSNMELALKGVLGVPEALARIEAEIEAEVLGPIRKSL